MFVLFRRFGGLASTRRRSTLIQRTVASLFSVDCLKAPAFAIASTLQLALNLFDFRCIAGTDSDFSGEYDVQHVNERIGRDVHQFSEHGLFPWELFAVALPIRNPAARSGPS